MSLPYRPPAQRIFPPDDSYLWNPPLVTAGCMQHHRASEMAVQKFTNTTAVTHDAATAYDEGGANGSPFNRRNWYDAGVGGGSTADTGAWKLPNACQPDHAAGASSIFDDGSGGTLLSLTDYPNSFNYYQQDGANKLNFSKCRDRGFKALRGSRVWHGGWGFKDRCATPPATTKYLKAHIRLHCKAGNFDHRPVDCADFAASTPTLDIDVEREFELQVDPLSGKITLNSSTVTNTVGTWDSGADAGLFQAFYDASLALTCGSDYTLDCAAHLAEYGQFGTESFSCTNTHLRRISEHGGESDTGYDYRDCEITLSETNPLASVQEDLETVLAAWNLASRAQYQWRTDGYCGFHPVVGRDEAATPQTPLQWILPTLYDQTPLGPGETEADHQAAWVMNGYCNDGIGGTPVPVPTGNITGRPLPDGYPRAFNFSIQTFDDSGPTGSGCYGNIIGYGMASPAILPPATTLWLENFENWKNNQASCAFAPFAQPQAWTVTTVDGITAQIYCEVKEWEYGSQNYFRPAGADRAKTDAAGVALWPKAWGILGREAVTVEDIGGGQVKFTLDAAGVTENGLWPTRDLRVGDTVRIFPETIGLSATAPCNTGALGDVVIDATDATSFTVTATFATYATAKWAMGGHDTRNHDELPAWPLNDPAPKGQFVYLAQTSSDAGAAAVTKEQHCLPYTPCAPAVLAIGYQNQVDGTADQKFPNAFYFALPAVIPPATLTDTQIWRGAVIQRMPDLLYIDKVDCTGDCTRAGCNEDFCDKDIDAVRPGNYPYQVVSGFTRNWDKTPWVEAMLELPTWDNGSGVTITAPALPTTAAGEIGAGNPKATAVTFPAYNLPANCPAGDQMRLYHTTIALVTTYYLDAPWVDTSTNYATW